MHIDSDTSNYTVHCSTEFKNTINRGNDFPFQKMHHSASGSGSKKQNYVSDLLDSVS